jgi:hypothetical protein
MEEQGGKKMKKKKRKRMSRISNFSPSSYPDGYNRATSGANLG